MRTRECCGSVSRCQLWGVAAYDPLMRARALAVPLALILLAGCGGGEDTQSPEVTTEPVEVEATTETVEASGLQMSGDFEEDLTEYTGIEPDDVDDFRAYIAEGICETDIDPDAVGPAAFSVMVKRYGDDDPASGTHPDLVRLVVAYDCPDRAELAEEYLSEVEG